MFGQINTFTAAAGKRDEVAHLVMSSTGGMPGCHSYVVATGADSTDILWATEDWENADMHAASRELPEVKVLAEKVMLMNCRF